MGLLLQSLPFVSIKQSFILSFKFFSALRLSKYQLLSLHKCDTFLLEGRKYKTSYKFVPGVHGQDHLCHQLHGFLFWTSPYSCSSSSLVHEERFLDHWLAASVLGFSNFWASSKWNFDSAADLLKWNLWGCFSAVSAFSTFSNFWWL